MRSVTPLIAVLRAAALVVLVVAVAACSHNAQAVRRESGLAGAAPGSAAGVPGERRRSRVLRDQLLGADAAGRLATLDKQAQWLNQYSNYRFLIEGHADERGTREYNIALGAGAPRFATTSSRAASRRAHPHHVVRQGTPGRGLQRHLVLVAESPCRDRARRHLVNDHSHEQPAPGA